MTSPATAPHTIDSIFARTAPSNDVASCINGIIFEHIDKETWRTALFSSASIASYSWLRDLLAASCDARYKHFCADVPITARLNADFHFSRKMAEANTLMTSVCPSYANYKTVSGPIRRYLLDNLVFTRDAVRIAECKAELPRVMRRGDFNDWIVGKPHPVWHCLQLIRTQRNNWRTNPFATQYAAQLYFCGFYFHDYMISPEEACERDLDGNIAMFEPLCARLEHRIFPLMLTSRQALLALGVLKNVDGNGHSMLQMFAYNICWDMPIYEVYNVLVHILGDEDPMTARTCNGNKTIYESIMRTVRLEARNDPSYASDSEIKKLDDLLSTPVDWNHHYNDF